MMHLIWYLRSAFCRHDWDYQESHMREYGNYSSLTREGIKVSATCKKCGWHRKYWKFN